MLHLLVVTKYDTTTNRNGITEHESAARSIDHVAGFFAAEEVIAIENKEKLKGIYFKISEKDRKLIEQKMELAGVRNMSVFLRKMAIDGYVINLKLPELIECVRLARYTETLLAYNGDSFHLLKFRRPFLHDRSDGFFRRQIVLTTRDKPQTGQSPTAPWHRRQIINVFPQKCHDRSNTGLAKSWNTLGVA